MKTIDNAGGAAPFKTGSENCLPIGTRLSDFEITGILGEGGFGIVYIAYDHSLHRTVAIKEYMPGALAMRAHDQGVAVRAERHQETFNVGLKSFISEARFLAQFDHPALVKVYRYWEENRTAYTAMQYYEGRTVKDIVENSPELVDEVWCRRILRQILQALEMLYTMKILHRDIAPDNIIVQENGDAVLLDFGSARQIIGDMTKGLTVILKPGYAPIEQYAGDASLEQGPWTDIYALAAVMYFAIAKEPPPTSIARMIKDPMVPLQTRAPAGFGEALLAAVDKALGVLAQDRPQSIDEFRELLGIVPMDPAPQRPGGAQRPPPPPPPPPPRPADFAKADAPKTPGPKHDSAREALLLEAALAAHEPEPSPTARTSRWILGGVSGALLLAAAFGIYGLLHSAADDTVMLALPQPQPALPDASPAPVKREPVKGLDPSETVIEPAATGPLRPSAPGKAAGAATAAPAAAPASPATVPVAAPTPAAAPDTATYRLAIKPWGTVYVDGKERGVSPPLKRLTLPVGKHRIRIVNPGFPEFTETVDLGKGKLGTIEHDFSAVRKQTH